MRFDIHVHTNAVDGRYSPRQVVAHAKKIGLNGIAIVDHDEVKGNIEAQKYAGDDFTVVPGIEFSTTHGHILGLGSTDIPEKYIGYTFKQERFPPPDEVIDLIHDRGGIAIAAHPFDRIRGSFGKAIRTLAFDAIEIINGHTLLNSQDPSKIADELGLPKVGGSDAHSIHEIGNICLNFDGDDVIEAIRKNKVEITSKPRASILSGFLKSGILKSYFGLKKY